MKKKVMGVEKKGYSKKKKERACVCDKVEAHRSAEERPGNSFLMGSRKLRAVASPALAPQPASGLNRMRQPLLPPLPSACV